MTRALLLIAGWIGRAVALWLDARRRPLESELASERLGYQQLREKYAAVRSRLAQMAPHRRPHYKSAERLAILRHRSRWDLSIEATAHAFVPPRQTIVN